MNTEVVETKTRYFDILDGPCKDLVYDSYKYARCNVTLPTVFTVAVGYANSSLCFKDVYTRMHMTNIKITDVEEDASDSDRLIIHGLYYGSIYPLQREALKFYALYDTNTRKGRFYFEVNHH